MPKKGTKRVKNKASNRAPEEPLIIKPREETPPKSGSNSDGGEAPMDVQVLSLENQILEMKRLQDSGGTALPELSLLEARLKVLKAKVRDMKMKYLEDDEVTAVEVLASFFGHTAPTNFNKAEEEYYENLRGFLDTWKVRAQEGRREGRVSLVEWLRSIKRSDSEGTRAFNAMRETVVDVGIAVSAQMVEYFSLFFGVLEGSEVATRVRMVKKTVLSESLEEGVESPVINRFYAVIESVAQRIRASDDDDTNEDQLFGKRENWLLSSIFFKVLYLEVAFCMPSFTGKLENKDLMSARDYLANFFQEKLNELSSEIDEFKKGFRSDGEVESKRKEFKEVLDSEIKQIWKGVNLRQKILTKSSKRV